ncbi:hypothetical protein [Oceanobacillus sp. CF4.6]|uniref:hypothetical protein n=1 Tax=Oceanobacillus sp. CF4.6 TaxID=3373080 RepID=UPI003EE67086
MAKLTARFDMEDKITKKLKNMHGDLEKIEKSRDNINKPIVMEAKDNATKQINKINKSVGKVIGSKEIEFGVEDNATKKMKKINETAEKIAEPKTITLKVVDKATDSLASVNNYMKRRMPRAHELVVTARDRSKSVLEGINRYLGRNILGLHVFEIMARDRAMPTMHKIANYARRSLSKGYNFSVRAIDVATKTVGRIASYTRTALPAYRDFTIRAINGASNVIGTVKRALFSIPSMITVTLAVVGIGSLGNATVGSAMDFEGYGTAMTHWLDGNQKQADDLIGWMGKFADTTPFSSAELFPALSRGIGVADGDIKQAQQLLEISSNMAALSPGKTVQDAMEALADARTGEFERMKEFNMKITKEDYDSAGWTGIVSEIDGTFKDGAKKFSQTASGQISTIKGYASTIFREAGTGVLTSMKPRLNEITKWLENNQDTWGEWKDTVQTAGEDAANWVFTKLEGAFSYLRDNYLENDEFKNLDFEGKVNFIMDDLGEWWDKTGRHWLVDVSKDVGEAIFDGVTWGLKEGFKGIGTMWSDAIKDPSVGSFASAGIATAIGMSVISLLVSPLITAFKVGGAIIKGALSAGRWMGGLFGKGKGPKVPPVAPVPGRGKTVKTTNNPTVNAKNAKPVYAQPWFNKGQKPILNVPNQNKNTSKLPKTPKDLAEGLSGIAKFGKRIPVIGTLLGGLSIATAGKGEKAGAVGGVAGGLGGAAAGAAIGSVVPGVGTVIGGILGGIGGSTLGQKIGDSINLDPVKEKFNEVKEQISSTLFSGDWWSGKWSSVKGWADEKLEPLSTTWENIKGTASETLFSADWWTGKWNGIKDTATSTIFSGDWWIEQAGFIYGYLEETIFSGDWWSERWEGVKAITAGTIFDGEWWKEKWEGVKGWTAEKWDSAIVIWESIKTKFAETVFNSEWWLEKWTAVTGWAQEKWDSAVVIWESIKTKFAETVFNSEWWLTQWESVKSWTQEKWDSAVVIWESVKTAFSETVFNGEWWKGKWDLVTGWASEKWDGAQEIWDSVKTDLSETLFDGEWWKGKWGDVMGWAQEKLGGLGSWVGGIVDNVKESFDAGREKGKKAANKPVTANRQSANANYANGGFINRPHLGLVGEAGPEMIIPLSSGRRGRAMDLYNQTGAMLGVKPYANGGMVGGIVTPQTQPTYMNNSELRSPINTVSQLQGINNSINNVPIELGRSIAGALSKTNNTISSESSRMNDSINTGTSGLKEHISSFNEKIHNSISGLKEYLSSKISKVEQKAEQALLTANNSNKSSASNGSGLEGRIASLIKQRGSTAEKYFAEIKVDGDWLNDWSHTGDKKADKPYLLAGFEYAKHLGFEPGVNGLKHLNRIKGYAKGTNGPLNSSETAWVGERGPELVRLPRGAEVYSNDESVDMVTGRNTVPADQMSGVVSSGTTKTSSGGSSKVIKVYITGENNFYNDTDPEEFGQKVVSVIERELETEYNEGGEMVVYE